VAVTRGVTAVIGHPKRLAEGEAKALAGADPGSLVNTAKLRNTPPPDSPLFRRVERFALQSVARSFLPTERVANCLRVATNDHVSIHHNIAKDSYGYRNLQTCGSIWMCPVCQGKISEKRRVDLTQALLNWKEQGGTAVLMTLTVQHRKSDSYSKSLDGLGNSFRTFLNGRICKRALSSMGVRGRIRALEVTYGENGWHPHFHVLFFLEGSLSDSMLSHFESLFLDLWKTACVSSGLNKPNSHGCQLQNGTYAAQYVTKWGLEQEMTKGHIKNSKSGYSPNDLLRAHIGSYKGDGISLAPGQARALFTEYALHMKGKKQLHFSRGLRDLLGLGVELTDQELVDQVEIQEVLFAKIPLSMWKIILKAEQRAEVLESCKHGTDFFFDFCINIWEKYQMEWKS